MNGIFVHRCGFDLDHEFLRETANMCHSFERHFLATQARVGEFDVVHAHDWLTADNGIHPESFDSACDPGEIKSSLGVDPMAPTILFAGRVVYQKGVDILIDAIPYVLKHVPTAMFVIAGDGEMRWDLEDATRLRGLDSNMRWLGKVPRGPLRCLLKSCDAVCVPSRNEPFGSAILEAWCASKPVVATVIGGPGEFVTHDRTGFSINPNSDSVAWGIGHIFADSSMLAKWAGTGGAKLRSVSRGTSSPGRRWRLTRTESDIACEDRTESRRALPSHPQSGLRAQGSDLASPAHRQPIRLRISAIGQNRPLAEGQLVLRVYQSG